MDKKYHILVVDDDYHLRKLLRTFLIEKGYHVDSVKNTKEARSKIGNILYDLIVLDVMMPGEDGLTFASKIREHSEIPILVLSAISEVENRIEGFEIGVDEYLPKPFEPRELLLRIKVILKRSKNQINIDDNQVNFGKKIYDLKNYLFVENNQNIYLSQNENKIFLKLYRSLGSAVTREELAKLSNISLRAVDVNINRLRKKLEVNPSHPIHLLTVRGKGYKLEKEQ